MHTPILERLISIVAPHACLGCGAEGTLLCADCSRDIPSLPERCYRCQGLSRDYRVCRGCRRASSLRSVWVRAQYGTLVKDLVYRFKFQRAQAGARPIAALMSEVLPYLPSNTVVAWIPTATTRQRQRGYDHAALLARCVATQNSLSYMPLLVRMGQSRQVGANRVQRQQQLTDAFRIVNSSRLQGAAVLLVDDIVTTGASLESAARTLKKAGAKSVDAVVFAQKL